MNIKKAISTALAVSFIFTSAINASASALGSTLIDGYTISIGQGTEATHNKWYSDQSGVGQQVENYITYTPNDNVEPIITNGPQLFGKINIMREVSRLRSLGITPLAGINADYFSLETGIPMSNAIVDNKILTKDDEELYAIGINNDNTAFMSKLQIKSEMIKADGTVINISNINKYRQPYAIYLMTNDFSTETHNKTMGYDVVLGSVNGEMKIGEKLTAVVESVDKYEGSIAIPDGKMVLTIDSNAPAELVEAVSALQIGEELTLTFSATGDERWQDAKLAIGAIGGMLIENGNINSEFEAGAHPRTALGIKEDGSILLYTIDGRQKGHSYGVQLKSLAARLRELGCTDAINLDGGGSTSIAMQMPGNSLVDIINSPSDGKVREVSNFIFLKNNLSKTGKLGNLTIYPLSAYLMTGADLKLETKASDTAFYQMNTPGNLEYYLDGNANSTISSDGTFTAKDNGQITVYARSGDVTTSRIISCFTSPTSIDIYNEDSNKKIDNIRLKRTEIINLTADAYAGYNKLIETDANFSWTCDETVGVIDDNGTFTAADVLDAEGNIYVAAGETTRTIPVKITKAGNESGDEMYTTIDVNKDDEIKITLTSNYGISVDIENIKLMVDGKRQEFNYRNNIISFKPDENAYKLTVFVTNSEGFTSFHSEIISDNKYENPFIDINGHWSENVTSFMYKSKIINGEDTAEGLKFNPDKAMTRSEFSVMITNYLGIDTTEYENAELPYNDISDIPKWAINSFKALYKLGIVKGVTEFDGNLYAKPISNITRAEASAIISRTLPDGMKLGEITATDKNEIADWAFDGISILSATGAINGYEDNTIRPKRNLTKAEAAKILYNII